MARNFSGLEGACIPFPGCPVVWLGTHLSLWMNLLVQEQDHLLAKDLTDKRAGLVGASSVEKSNPLWMGLLVLDQGRFLAKDLNTSFFYQRENS